MSLISEGLAQAESLGAEENRAVFCRQSAGTFCHFYAFSSGAGILEGDEVLESSKRVNLSLDLERRNVFVIVFQSRGQACFLYKAYHVPAKFTAALKKFQGDKVAGTE